MDKARDYFNRSLGLYEDFFAAPESAQASRLNDRARATRANTEAVIAALDVQMGNAVAAETRLRAQIPVLEQVVAQMDSNDKRATSETYFALGNAYNYLANVHASQGHLEDVKPNLLRAHDAFNACIVTIGDPKDSSDRFKKVNVLPECFSAKACKKRWSNCHETVFSSPTRAYFARCVSLCCLVVPVGGEPWRASPWWRLARRKMTGRLRYRRDRRGAVCFRRCKRDCAGGTACRWTAGANVQCAKSFGYAKLSDCPRMGSDDTGRTCAGRCAHSTLPGFTGRTHCCD